MITEVKKNNIERLGVRAESQFQIKATGKAFRILSDGLYSDKIRAIIRELSCNAYDAHVLHGNADVPFEIQLPNKLDPTFRIRDFAMGLSNRDIKSLYTTYFESTKTESNDFTGCLGLGSKSPFSYVESFMVTSYYRGFKRVYSAFLNEDDTPTIALLWRGKTDEPSGLEVSFSVNHYDFYDFESKAKQVLSVFPVTPKILGSDIEITNIHKDGYKMQGDGWGLRMDNGSARAIMGNVAYPLSDFAGVCDSLEPSHKSLLGSVPIDIYFDMGTLEMAASREYLSYKKSRNHIIVSRLDNIIEEIRNKVFEDVKNCPNLWEARIMIHDLIKGGYNQLRSILEGHTFEWGGEKVVGSNYIEIAGDSVVRYKVKDYYNRRSGYYDKKVTKYVTSVIEASHDAVIFWNDIQSGWNKRCRQFALENEDLTVYLLKVSSSDLEDAKDILGGAEIRPVSSIKLNKNVSISNGTNPLNTTKVMKYKDSCSRVASNYWEKADIDISIAGIYVIIDRYKIDGEFANRYIERFKSCLVDIQEDADFDIIGVRWKDREKLVKNGWVTLSSYVNSKAESYFEKNKLADCINANRAMDEISRYHSSTIRIINNFNIDTDLFKGFVDLYNEMKDLSERHSNINNLNYIARSLGIEIENSTKDYYKELSDKIHFIHTRYPLLSVIEGYRLNDNFDAVRDYIMGIDLMEEGEELEKKVA